MMSQNDGKQAKSRVKDYALLRTEQVSRLANEYDLDEPIANQLTRLGRKMSMQDRQQANLSKIISTTENKMQT